MKPGAIGKIASAANNACRQAMAKTASGQLVNLDPLT